LDENIDEKGRGRGVEGDENEMYSVHRVDARDIYGEGEGGRDEKISGSTMNTLHYKDTVPKIRNE
jgi:hypothetical protein